MMSWRQTLALIRKELQALFKEPANRIILFVPVLLQALLYGYVATYDLHDRHLPCWMRATVPNRCSCWAMWRAVRSSNGQPR